MISFEDVHVRAHGRGRCARRGRGETREHTPSRASRPAVLLAARRTLGGRRGEAPAASHGAAVGGREEVGDDRRSSEAAVGRYDVGDGHPGRERPHSLNSWRQCAGSGGAWFESVRREGWGMGVLGRRVGEEVRACGMPERGARSIVGHVLHCARSLRRPPTRGGPVRTRCTHCAPCRCLFLDNLYWCEAAWRRGRAWQSTFFVRPALNLDVVLGGPAEH